MQRLERELRSAKNIDLIKTYSFAPDCGINILEDGRLPLREVMSPTLVSGFLERRELDATFDFLYQRRQPTNRQWRRSLSQLSDFNTQYDQETFLNSPDQQRKVAETNELITEFNRKMFKQQARVGLWSCWATFSQSWKEDAKDSDMNVAKDIFREILTTNLRIDGLAMMNRPPHLKNMLIAIFKKYPAVRQNDKLQAICIVNSNLQTRGKNLFTGTGLNNLWLEGKVPDFKFSEVAKDLESIIESNERDPYQLNEECSRLRQMTEISGNIGKAGMHHANVLEDSINTAVCLVYQRRLELRQAINPSDPNQVLEYLNCLKHFGDIEKVKKPKPNEPEIIEIDPMQALDRDLKEILSTNKISEWQITLWCQQSIYEQWYELASQTGPTALVDVMARYLSLRLTTDDKTVRKSFSNNPKLHNWMQLFKFMWTDKVDADGKRSMPKQAMDLDDTLRHLQGDPHPVEKLAGSFGTMLAEYYQTTAEAQLPESALKLRAKIVEFSQTWAKSRLSPRYSSILKALQPTTETTDQGSEAENVLLHKLRLSQMLNDRMYDLIMEMKSFVA